MLGRYKKTLITCYVLLEQVRSDPERNVHICYEIQEILIKHITYVERQVRRLRRDVRLLKSLFADRDHRLSKEESRNVKDLIAWTLCKIEFYHALLLCFRDIGDAIAYTYINRWDLKPLSFKQAPGFLLGKTGTRLERRIFRHVRHRLIDGVVVMMNDLTNCLRYGDLTVAGDGHILTVLEVKSSRRKSNKREKRQSSDLARILEYLDNDVMHGDHPVMRRLEIHAPEVTHTEPLNVLIRSTRMNSCRFLEVEEGLYYYIVRGSSSNKDIENFCNLLAEREDHFYIIHHVNTSKHVNAGYYPFTLAIFDPAHKYEFYAGDLNIFIAADVNRIKRELGELGYKVTMFGNGTREITGQRCIMQIESEETGGRIYITDHLFGRIFNEFISIRWMAEHTAALMSRVISV